MNSIEEKIALITVRIQELAAQQHVFNAQLMELKKELELLKTQAGLEANTIQTGVENTPVETEDKQAPVLTAADLLPPVKRPVQPVHPAHKGKPPVRVPVQRTETAVAHSPVQEAKNKNVEEFLGKNLASKVGILVTVIGIFIGAKYAIEHDLISVQLRIILGYLAGIVLAGLGYRLRNKYPGYSAVLMGGGLCVAYFITYIAFTYYQLFPRMAAFGIMVAVTAATVYASALYNRVIIAHLAQVGAYAIPFLLSNNSGNYGALFTYIAIINAGMLIVSFKKNWSSLVYAAFGTTWLIYIFWFCFVGQGSKFTGISWSFVIIYFILFYASILGYKLIRKQAFNAGDIIILPVNAFIIYFVGMELLRDAHVSGWTKGGFTLLNGLVHFAVAILLKRRTGKEDAAYQMLISLLITFIGISVPVALKGNWIPLTWTAQALSLYFLGRKWKSALYLNFSLAASMLALFAANAMYFFRLFEYDESAGSIMNHKAFAHPAFYTGLLVYITFILLTGWNKRHDLKNDGIKGTGLTQVFYTFIIPIFTILFVYILFLAEINLFFTNIENTLSGADGSFGPWSTEVANHLPVALLLYSFFFVCAIAAANQYWFKSQALRIVGAVLFILLLWIWGLAGLPKLNDVAANYYQKQQSGLYFGAWNLLSRYVFLLPIAGLFYYFKTASGTEESRKRIKQLWPQLLVLVLIVFLSFEYLLWTRVSGANNQYKYGLSVLWGLFALALIVYGIWKKHRGLRLSAMAMLVITLIKLTFFDLSHANTLTRTITYIALGGILLLISYLYNRYKELLFGNDEPDAAG
ncbi:MAG: DUF2339 domain-containing protein [Pseudobacter sp.]|uniref:DUF2339 domain-containing protein n=1 Tax=Pseudobacter sp. TaxID=2045420 RepID=UPI003F7E128B